MKDPVTTFIGRSIGAIILAFFGAAWIVGGLLVSGRASALTVGAVCVCAVLIAGVALAQRRHRPPGSPSVRFNGRLYGIVNAVQWTLIVGAAAILPAFGNRDWIDPVSILIVGLHFLPLARGFGERLYYFTGAAMVLLAGIFPFVAESGPSSPVGLFGSGVILWLSAGVALAMNGRYKGLALTHHCA